MSKQMQTIQLQYKEIHQLVGVCVSKLLLLAARRSQCPEEAKPCCNNELTFVLTVRIQRVCSHLTTQKKSAQYILLRLPSVYV